MPLNFVIRVDASGKIGAGHAMRCLTLANALKIHGITSTFLCKCMTEAMAGKIKNDGHALFYLSASPGSSDGCISRLTDESIELWQQAEIREFDWLIVDHYAIDADWEREAMEQRLAARLLVIDDLADRPHASDILIDVNPATSAADYHDLIPETSQRLIGLDYALLRPEFAELRAKARSFKPAPGVPAKVLVTLGGGDNELALRETLKAMEILADRHEFELTVIGKKNGYIPSGNLSGNTTWLEHTSNMETCIAGADLMICAAGGTSWERCALGVPGVVLTLADNQKANAKAIEQAGAGICVETSTQEIADAVTRLFEEPALYATIAENAWNLCDGKGAERVVKAILGQSMKLVPATLDDAQFVFDARYSGQAYRFYKNPVMPDYETHMPWYEAALVSDRYWLFCVMLGRDKIAHVRFDLEPGIEDRAEIGIAMAPEFRGKGLSKAALRASLDLAAQRGIKVLDAIVHRENIASRRLFETAGFEVVRDGADAFIDYQWQK